MFPVSLEILKRLALGSEISIAANEGQVQVLARTSGGSSPRAEPSKMKTPPASEDTDGVFHAFTSCEVAALERQTSFRSVCSGKPGFFRDCRPHGTPGSSATMENRLRCFGWLEGRNALAILATVATVGATTMSARAEARGWRGG